MSEVSLKRWDSGLEVTPVLKDAVLRRVDKPPPSANTDHGGQSVFGDHDNKLVQIEADSSQ